eukprot:TRINITY_DN4503_c0_g2_i1.p1 TRINITY_DN4503_c0_g2~~TRINITY_DN4503_c0_g2_i1.p1  ORF type:complete len:114 (-),score=3.84 TRINITY_DN4503_c0_g2_i1:732-1073(-)
MGWWRKGDLTPHSVENLQIQLPAHPTLTFSHPCPRTLPTRQSGGKAHTPGQGPALHAPQTHKQQYVPGLVIFSHKSQEASAMNSEGLEGTQKISDPYVLQSLTPPQYDDILTL